MRKKMFSKIINILLVYLLCIANFAVLTLPYIAILYPFLHFTSFAELGVQRFILICAFALSSLMFVMWVLDFLFSSSINNILKHCKSYKHKQYAKYFAVIDRIYKQIQRRYGISFYILIKNSNQIDAFATASFSKRVVVISTQTLSKIERSCNSAEEFENAMSGLLAHEASHLLNKDFLPGALLNLNQRATYSLAKFTSTLYALVFYILARVPFFGGPIALFAKAISNNIERILRFFMDKIIFKIYYFFAKILTRGIEYRSDADAAKMFGPSSISSCLQILAGDSYNSVFSTHPSTPLRIKAASKFAKTKLEIRQHFLTGFLNVFSIAIIICAPFYLYKVADPLIIYKFGADFAGSILSIYYKIVNGYYKFLYSIKNLSR